MPTYRDAGVDLEAAEQSVTRLGPVVRATWTDAVVGGFGGFAAGIAVPPGLTEPVMMLSTDGVGTKAEIARKAGEVEGLGFDLVAMCADDLAAAGAVPIAMSDYIAIGRLEVEVVSGLVGSIAQACASAGIALLGGETAEHPGVMASDQFDLAGTALGVVERGREIDGSAIRPGDAVIGVESPNLRSNGFSLVRATVLESFDLDEEMPGTGRTVAEELLSPSVIYTPAIVRLQADIHPHGLAHVTGGGLPGNVARVLPQGTAARIDPSTWERTPVFDSIAAIGSVSVAEMYRTFNMGVGFVAITESKECLQAIHIIEDAGHRAWRIGEIVAGDGEVLIEGVK